MFSMIRDEIADKIVTDQDILTRYFYKYRLTIKTNKNKRLLFLLVTDLTNDSRIVGEELELFAEMFQETFKLEDLSENFLKKHFNTILPVIERLYLTLGPKVSILGFSGVGKTSLTKLIENEIVPDDHVPTIWAEVDEFQDDHNGFLRIWDYAGQEKFRSMWEKFLDGSDMVFIVTDSTEKNVLQSVKLLDFIKQKCPNAAICVIANKQDLPEALPLPDIVEKFGGIDIYPMVAKDRQNREYILTIFAKTLNMAREFLESPIQAFGKLASLRKKQQERKERLTATGSSLNASTLEYWVLKHQTTINWIFQKAFLLYGNGPWHIQKLWLEGLDDFPRTPDFDDLWFTLANSRYGTVKKDAIIFNDLAKTLWELLNSPDFGKLKMDFKKTENIIEKSIQTI
jgi:small GTP-binding protein